MPEAAAAPAGRHHRRRHCGPGRGLAAWPNVTRPPRSPSLEAAAAGRRETAAGRGRRNQRRRRRRGAAGPPARRGRPRPGGRLGRGADHAAHLVGAGAGRAVRTGRCRLERMMGVPGDLDALRAPACLSDAALARVEAEPELTPIAAARRRCRGRRARARSARRRGRRATGRPAARRRIRRPGRRVVAGRDDAGPGR